MNQQRVLNAISSELGKLPEWIALRENTNMTATLTAIWQAVCRGVMTRAEADKVVDALIEIAVNVFGLPSDAVRNQHGARMPNKGVARTAVAHAATQILGTHAATEIASVLGYRLPSMRVAIATTKARYGTMPEVAEFNQRVKTAYALAD